MNKLKLIGMTIFELVKQVFFLPRSIAKAVDKRRWRAVQEQREAERLDRIRNPSKYLGKQPDPRRPWIGPAILGSMALLEKTLAQALGLRFYLNVPKRAGLWHPKHQTRFRLPALP